MLQKDPAQHQLPDIASQRPELMQTGALDWVGMSGIELPIRLCDTEGNLYRLPARADAFVSLQAPEARGIHMSRLYQITQNRLDQEELSLSLLSKILPEFLESHTGLSDHAKISVSFQALVKRRALKSDNWGWRTYPVQLSAEQVRGKSPRYFLEVLVTYSSTCPASAALSRQLIQESFRQNFFETQVEAAKVIHWLGTPEGMRATPHAQRSQARVKVELSTRAHFEFLELIDLVEEVLQTPVQTIVKREDEQEFALRNGQSLMFCEDAARRVQRALESEPEILDYIAEMRHMESLHPHDAVSRVSKRQQLQFS